MSKSLLLHPIPIQYHSLELPHIIIFKKILLSAVLFNGGYVGNMRNGGHGFSTNVQKLDRRNWAMWPGKGFKTLNQAESHDTLPSNES